MHATVRPPPKTGQGNVSGQTGFGQTLKQEFAVSQVYALRRAGSTYVASESKQSDFGDQTVRFAVCVPKEVAYRRSRESPPEGEPFGIIHDAFSPGGKTYSFFSGRVLGTGETVLREGFIPNAEVYFVELGLAKAQELAGTAVSCQALPQTLQVNTGAILALPSAHRGPPPPSTNHDLLKEREYVEWGQGDFKQTVPVGLAFYQPYKTTGGEVKGEWLVLSREEKKDWEPAYPPNPIKCRAATNEEIKYAKMLGNMASRTS